MATVAISENFLVVTGQCTFYAFDIRNGKRVKIKSISEPIIEDNPSNQSQNTILHSHIICCTLSQNEKLFGLCTYNKKLFVFQTNDWSIKTTRELLKRPTGIIMDDLNGRAIICDKAGDVYWFDVNGDPSDISDNGELMLGHVSMLLNIKLSKDSTYLATADRDEVIRISHYPNAYAIAMYCLGHTKFVHAIDFVRSDGNLLLSGGGDGQLILWDFKSGKALDRKGLRDGESSLVIIGIANVRDEVFVICEGFADVIRFKINKHTLIKMSPIPLEGVPRVICGSSKGIVVLAGDHNKVNLCLVTDYDNQENLQISGINKQLQEESVLKDLDWSSHRLIELKRFGKRKEVDGFLQAVDENPCSKMARNEDGPDQAKES